MAIAYQRFLVLPEISEPLGRKFAISNRMLDILVAEIVLQRSSIHARRTPLDIAPDTRCHRAAASPYKIAPDRPLFSGRTAPSRRSGAARREFAGGGRPD